MKKITPKIGFIIFIISPILLIIEFFYAMFVEITAISKTDFFALKILYFIRIFTFIAGLLAPICGILNKILNKWNKSISWKLFLLPIFILSAILYFSFSNFDSVGGRWWRYDEGGNYIGSNPAFLPDGKKIIYSSPITGHGDIYVMNIDGSNRKRLTTSNDYEGEPVYSPDGLKICYVREKKGQGQIFVMDKDGKNQKQLTSGGKYSDSCSFSPDSKQVTYRNVSDDKICIVNIDDKNQKCFKKNRFIIGGPVFSSDGKSIYYCTYKINKGRNFRITGVKVWKLDIDTLKVKLVSTLKGELYGIRYSPDLKKIVYVAFKGSPQQYQQIFTVNVDGTSKRQLTKSKDHKSVPSFSYDRSRIVFLSNPSGRTGIIMIINSDGSGLKSVGKIY